MDWNSITDATYFDSRNQNSKSSSNSEEEFEQHIFEQNEEGLYFTMQKRDNYNNEDGNERNIQSNECASLYNSDY